jgi:hypothetical protein
LVVSITCAPAASSSLDGAAQVALVRAARVPASEEGVALQGRFAEGGGALEQPDRVGGAEELVLALQPRQPPLIHAVHVAVEGVEARRLDLVDSRERARERLAKELGRPRLESDGRAAHLAEAAHEPLVHLAEDVPQLDRHEARLAEAGRLDGQRGELRDAERDVLGQPLARALRWGLVVVETDVLAGHGRELQQIADADERDPSERQLRPPSDLAHGRVEPVEELGSTMLTSSMTSTSSARHCFLRFHRPPRWSMRFAMRLPAQ